MKSILFVLLGSPEDPMAEMRCENAGVCPIVGDTVIFDGGTDNPRDSLEGRVIRREFRMTPFFNEITVITEPVQ